MIFSNVVVRSMLVAQSVICGVWVYAEREREWRHVYKTRWGKWKKRGGKGREKDEELRKRRMEFWRILDCSRILLAGISCGSLEHKDHPLLHSVLGRLFDSPLLLSSFLSFSLLHYFSLLFCLSRSMFRFCARYSPFCLQCGHSLVFLFTLDHGHISFIAPIYPIYTFLLCAFR